jgi:hypothetical protein
MLTVLSVAWAFESCQVGIVGKIAMESVWHAGVLSINQTPSILPVDFASCSVRHIASLCTSAIARGNQPQPMILKVLFRASHKSCNS